MTLRTKLSLAVGCAIALSIVLTLFLTWRRVSHFAIASEEEHFASIADTVENNLESAYKKYLAIKVRVVLNIKRQMRILTEDSRTDLHMVEATLPPSETRERLEKLLLHNHAGEQALNMAGNTYIELTSMTTLLQQGLPALGVKPDMLNVKKQSLADLLSTLSSEGEFALWPAVKSHDEQVLLFFLPMDLDSERILVSGLKLTALFQEAETLVKNSLATVRQNFENIRFYEHGCLLLCDEQGQILIKRGDASHLHEHLATLCAKVKGQSRHMGRVQTDTGEYLYHVAWIKAQHYFFIMAAPLDVLRAPSTDLISQLLPIGLGILAVATAFTIFIVIRALHPLHQLRDCVGELAALNPSSSSSLDEMENMLFQRLNVQRHDELGDLARSFATMGRELAKNIRTSMAVMTTQKRMEGELSAARNIQIGILPMLNTTSIESGFAVSAFLEPAREVGGDLYDYFSLDDGRKAIVMGDVSDKGVPAALFMTMTVTLIRYALRSGLDPAQTLTQINALLEEHNPGNMFVTLFLALFTPETGDLLYANGGHCLPYIVDTAGHIHQLERLSGPLVGAMPDVDFISFKDKLAPDEMCFLYTDGVTEAMNPAKEFYGDERLTACLVAHASEVPHVLQKSIYADICAFRGDEPPSDDITMLTLRRFALAEENKQ